jgi:hypothetical protein
MNIHLLDFDIINTLNSKLLYLSTLTDQKILNF